MAVSVSVSPRGWRCGFRDAPLYHCCSSFLSKCVAFSRSCNSCCDSLLWLPLRCNVSLFSTRLKYEIPVLLLISCSRPVIAIFSAEACLRWKAG